MQEHGNRRQAMPTAVSYRRSEKWHGKLEFGTSSTSFRRNNAVFSAYMAIIFLNNTNHLVFIPESVFVTYEINI
jgi:hypothetical protein